MLLYVSLYPDATVVAPYPETVLSEFFTSVHIYIQKMIGLVDPSGIIL